MKLLVVSLLDEAAGYAELPDVPEQYLRINDQPVVAGFAPWPVAPDLLVDEMTQTWCGLTFQVGPAGADTVEQLASRSRNRALRLFDPRKCQVPSYYEPAGLSASVNCELLWKSCERLEYRFASCTADVWFYPIDDKLRKYAIAIGVINYDEIADEHKLRLPDLAGWKEMRVEVVL